MVKLVYKLTDVLTLFFLLGMEAANWSVLAAGTPQGGSGMGWGERGREPPSSHPGRAPWGHHDEFWAPLGSHLLGGGAGLQAVEGTCYRWVN